VVEPVTPPRKTPARKAKAGKDPVNKKLFPERDSPNNPFLVAVGSPESLPPGSTSPEPHTPEPYVEKPTLTYVFRGVKAIVDNPLYNPSHRGRVPSPAPGSPSLLPEDHPDFTPTEYCPPKLLFPEARKHNHARARSRRDVATTDLSSPTVVADPPSSSTAVDELPRTPVKSKAKRSKTPPRRVRSEWDSSDDEGDARGHPRARQLQHSAVQGVRPKVPHLPGVREAPAQHGEAGEERLGQRPKRPVNINRLTKIAPLLVGADVPSRR